MRLWRVRGRPEAMKVNCEKVRIGFGPIVDEQNLFKERLKYMCVRADDGKKTYSDEDLAAVLLKMAEEETTFQGLLDTVTEEPPPTRYSYLRSEKGWPPKILKSRDGKSWESVRGRQEFVTVLSVLLDVAYAGAQTDYAVLAPGGQLLRRSTGSGGMWEQIMTFGEQESALAEIFDRLPRKIKGEHLARLKTSLNDG